MVLTANGCGGVGVVFQANDAIPLPDLHNSVFLVCLLHLERLCLLGLKQLRIGRRCLFLENIVLVHHHCPPGALSRRPRSTSVTRRVALACSRLCRGDVGRLGEVDGVGGGRSARHVFVVFVFVVVVAVGVYDLRVGVEDALVESVVPSFLFLVWPPQKRFDAAPSSWVLWRYVSESGGSVW
jgi:hypothetical protein